MPQARYPRPGTRLAPASLAPFLDQVVPPEFLPEGHPPGLRLCHLDASAWTTLGPTACHLAAGLLAKVVQRQSCALGRLRFAGLPHDLGWDDMWLGVRAWNVLVRRLRLSSPAGLNGRPLRDLFRERNFGARSLLDLLTALEEATELPSVCEPLGPVERVVTPAGSSGAPKQGTGEQPSLEGPSSEALLAELSELDRVLTSHVVSALDPRFGTLVRRVAPGVASTADLRETLLAAAAGAQWHDRRAAAVRDLRTVIEAAREASLPVELEALARAACPSERHAALLLRRLGWDGRGGATLQEAAEEHGLSRERVRQVCDVAWSRMTVQPVFAPAAARALAIAAAHPLGTIEAVCEALRAERLIPETEFAIDFIPGLGRLFGRGDGPRLDPAGEWFLAVGAANRIVGAAARAASRLARRFGVASVGDVAEALRRDRHVNAIPGEEDVARLLRARRDLVRLDQAGTWFAGPNAEKNPLLRRVRRVICVAGAVRVSELRSGLQRDYRLGDAVPPCEILLRLCASDPRLSVSGGFVASRGGVELGAELTPAERTLWSVLSEQGPLMERTALERACRAAGVTRPSFQAALTYSPIVIRYAPGVYGLRGIPIAPGAADAIRPGHRRRRRFLLESEWTNQGRVRLTYRLSAGSLASGVVTVPAAFSRFMQASFRVIRLGQRVGTFKCRGNQGWGLGPLLRREQAGPGDVLVLEFDLRCAEVEATLVVRSDREREMSAGGAVAACRCESRLEGCA